MTQSHSTRNGSGGARLPSVQPDKVRKAILDREQLEVANEFFASLDPDQIVVEEKKKSVAVAVAAPSEFKGPAGELVAELDAPQEELWEDSLDEALGSKLQQSIPVPAARSTRPKKAASRGAIPMARRAKRGIEIRERDDEPFQWRELLTQKGLKKNMGFLISLFLHILLLLFLSLLVVQSGMADSRLFLDAGEAPAALDEELLNEVNVNPVVFENDNLEEVQPDDLLEEMMEADASEELAELADSNDNNQPNGGFAANRPALGDGKSATFFGTKASGRRFVFVVDRSTSMEYGSGDGPSREMFNRYDVAKSELLNAIESLQPHQEFFVVMFADSTVPMFGEHSIEESGEKNFEMISATTENKARFQNWLSEVTMGPGTDPRNAVELAISMTPDAIFMLSDGEFIGERRGGGPKTKDIINKHVRQGTIVPINTVSLVVEETVETMEGIARVSGGNFRFTTILDYVKQVAQHRGAMRTRALEQIINSSTTWKQREEIISNQLVPMLTEYSGVDKANAESLLHLATMGFFRQHVDSVFRNDSNAETRWSEIVHEIDGYYKTEQPSALGQGRELEQKLVLAMLDQKDDSFIGLFDKLEMDRVGNTTMIEMVNAIQRSHGKFGTSPASVGWLRELIARLKGKEPKDRSQLARVNWNPQQAETAINRLFEDREKRAREMFRKYTDRSKGASFRDRVGEALVKKYPETKEAGRVRQDLAQQRAKDVPVGIDGEQEPDDPFVR